MTSVAGEGFGAVGGLLALAAVGGGVFRALLRRRYGKEIQDPTQETLNGPARVKSALLANINHELRTPLSILLGYCERLRDPLTGLEDRTAAVAAIEHQGKLLLGIVDELLLLSTSEAGDLPVNRQSVSVSHLSREVLRQFQCESIREGVQLTMRSVGPLPDCVETDVALLRLLMRAVVGNALKFTLSGTVKVTLSALTEGDRNLLAWDVEDTGIGMDASAASRLFAPFTQGDSSHTRQFGGIGLGLAVARRVARSLGGDVVLSHSQPSVGSTFRITCAAGPLIVTCDSGRSCYGSNPCLLAESGGAGDGVLRGLSLLLVEDSPDIRMLVKLRLEAAMATVAVACDGREGVGVAEQHDFDVVLMDIQMPRMDGFTAVVELRGRGYRRPIIALTAHATIEERERCLAMGFNEHVSKPIDYGVLFRKIAACAPENAALPPFLSGSAQSHIVGGLENQRCALEYSSENRV